MKKKFFFLLLCALPVLGQMTALADEASADMEVQTEAETEAASWSDFLLSIDGEEYQFPMMYEDFTACGWSLEYEEEAENTLEPYQYSIFSFVKEDRKVSVYILNLGVNTVSVSECIVAGISIDSFYWDEDVDSTVELPLGITRGISTLEDIEAAYGTPTDVYEGTLYTQYTYEEDYNQEVELTVYLDSGVLEDIQIENFTEPEDFDPGEMSTEVPQSVLAYVKPDALSSDLTAYEIEIDGDVYELPVPVSTLIEDGWTLDTDDSDSMIVAQYYGWVALTKNNQSFSAIVWNEEDYATTPENCWLEELEVGSYTLDLDGALPGGIEIGITEEEFLAILEENGMEYEYSESGDYHYYTYNSPSYGSSCEVTIYVGENSYFEKDTIIGVSCENSVD